GIGAVGDAVAGAQQPAVQPVLLDTRPGQRGGMLERADLRRAHRDVAERPERDHVVWCELHHRARLRPDADERCGVEQMADDIGQRWDGAVGSAVADRHPGSELGPRNHQWPNGSGPSPGVHDSPGTPQPCDLTARLAERACRPIKRSRYKRPSKCPVSCWSMRANNPEPSMFIALPSASSPVTLAHCARPVGNDSPGTERQPSSSSSGSGMVSGTSEVSSTGLTTTPRRRADCPRSSAQSYTNTRSLTPIWLA